MAFERKVVLVLVWESQETCVTDGNDMTLAVKVALNSKTTIQPSSFFENKKNAVVA